MNTYVVTVGGSSGDRLLADTASRAEADAALRAKVSELTQRFGYRVREDAADEWGRTVRLRNPRTHQWLTVSLIEV